MDRLEERLAEVEIKLKLERRIDKLKSSVRSCKIWLIVLGILWIFLIMASIGMMLLMEDAGLL